MRDFEGWTDEKVRDYLINSCEMLDVRKLADGEWIGLYRLIYTLSVCMGIGEITSFKYRWCFEDPTEAILFFHTAVEFDDIPVQRNSLKGHRYSERTGPLLKQDIYGKFDSQ